MQLKKQIKNNDKIKNKIQAQKINSHPMPLHELNNSAVVRNKENARQIDPQQSLNSSPIKYTTANQLKNSPQKKNLNAQINQLKIKLSDRDFQLKRLEQDCSVKLALMQKQLTKQKNDKNRILKQSKQKLEEDRSYYQTKINTLQLEWNAKLQKIKKQTVNQTKALEDRQKNSLKEFYELSIKELKSEFLAKQNQLVKEKEELSLAHQKQLNFLQSKHKSELIEINGKNQAQLNHLKVTHLSQLQFYQRMENQKLKEQNTVSKILSDKIRGFEQENRLLREQISELNKEIQIKTEQIQNEKRQKQNIRLDKICLQRKLGRLEPEMRQNCEKEIKKAKDEYERLLSNQISLFSEKLSEVTKLHQHSTVSYQIQIAQLQERCKQVAALHSSLKSNQQDIRKIEMLQLKLIKREMQLQNCREQSKMCRLELGNMDQMMQKMFEQAKVKSLKSRRHKLPSLLFSNQHKTTMDCYSGVGMGQGVKEMVNGIKEKENNNKKFSIREVNVNNYNSAMMGKGKESDFSVYE